MNRYDCLDLKVQLSAYVDGELPASERGEADRHLLACRDCRDLLGRTESNDQAIRELYGDGTAAMEEGSLPPGFEQAVLSRIDRRHRFQPRHFSASLGILSAAASLVLVATLLFVASVRSQNGGGVQGNLVNENAMFEPLDEGVFGPPRPRWTRDSGEAGYTLTADEMQALQNTAAVVRRLVNTPFEDIAGRERLRATVRYDELAVRLAAIQPKLDASGRRTVGAARAVLLEVQLEHGDVNGWASLQEDLQLIDLGGALDAIVLAVDAQQTA